MIAGFPLINVTNYSALGFPANEPVQYFVTDWQFGDKFTWVKAKHILKWGIDYNRYQINQPYFNNSRGTMTANGNWTGNGTAANGNAVGDLLLGLLNSSTLNTQNSRNTANQNSALTTRSTQNATTSGTGNNTGVGNTGFGNSRNSSGGGSLP